MENIDYIKNRDPEAERRFVSHEVEMRADGDVNKIEGYAAVFNSDSEDFGGWVERVDPNAFSDVMNDEVFALFNHDPNYVLARNKVTLNLSVDEHGLRYSFIPPNTTVGNDLKELVRTNVITKSSFAFRVSAQEWVYSQDKSKPSVRIIKKLSRMYDVSPVTYPAYPDTSVGTRSFKTELEKHSDNYVHSIDAIYFNSIINKHK